MLVWILKVNNKEPFLHEMTPNLLYVRYLMSSYLYYNSYPIIPYTDYQFDWLCKELLNRWDEVDHIHKYLTTEEDLKAGTGFAIKFPLIVQNCAIEWANSF